MITLIACAVLLSSPPQVDSDSPHKIAHGTSIVSSGGEPVTEAEALKVFTQNQAVLSHALECTIGGQPALHPKSSPVTREETVHEFYRLLTALEPIFKFTPNPSKVDPAVLKIASSQRPQLIKLIKLGFIGRVSPLATGPTDTLSVSQFGDALGFFVARVAQLTNLPTSKWTPILGAGGPG